MECLESRLIVITGIMLRDSFISAANNISVHRKPVDALNVFPVPDGDTGTNMSMTMGAAKRELLLLPENATAGEIAASTASALLRGARGNSGVILSLLFRGFAKGLAGKQTATASDLAAALEIGVDAAYNAVMKPTEGTILTVARESSQRASEEIKNNPDVSAADLWAIVVAAAKVSLEHTPELLPVLKKAGVVDAGGKGLVVIFEGMLRVFQGGPVIADLNEQTPDLNDIPNEKNAAGEYEGEITFTYCTEFIVVKHSNDEDTLSLRAYLESIGDSVVVVDDDEIIKCHVHTDNPGNALQKGLEFGQLTNLKIENMREQHANQKKSTQIKKQKTFQYIPVDPERKYGFVAVAAGEGVEALFYDLGVDHVVSGGQTMNPSTNDLLEAIQATPARHVIVLPNNKNIIMSAEQTIKLADRKVYVLPTKTIPQGLSAMLAFDAEAKVAQNQLNMLKAAEKVGTGQITYAARDSSFDGHKIKKGELLAIENGKIVFTEKDIVRAVQRLVKSMVKRESSFVTVLYGADVNAGQAQEIEEVLCQKLPNTVELAVMNGGQPVYYCIISVE